MSRTRRIGRTAPAPDWLRRCGSLRGSGPGGDTWWILPTLRRSATRTRDSARGDRRDPTGRLAGAYRALLEGHLQRRARELLADASLGVGEVAWRLGYEDPSNFGRACRRWFGKSPAALQKELSEPGS